MISYRFIKGLFFTFSASLFIYSPLLGQTGKKLMLNDDSLKVALYQHNSDSKKDDFKIKIYKRGFAYYQFDKYKKRKRTYKLILTEEEINSIIENAYKYQFFDMNDRYTDSTSSKTASTTIVKIDENYIKKVIRVGMQPKPLLLLELSIKELINRKVLKAVKLKDLSIP